MSKLKPLYDLEKIKNCIRENKPKTIIFPAASKSFKAVVAVFKERGSEISEAESKRYILDTILNLKTADFCGHGEFFGSPADVYAKTFDGENWYIKLDFDDQALVLQEISFHPADYPMELQNGKRIEKGKCQKWQS